MKKELRDRFAGIDRLYGVGTVERHAAARVAVVGMGGVGSWVVEALARSGVGHLTLIDADDICVSNTNRQLHAVAGNEGRPKTEAVAERARAIHPAIRTTLHQRFLSRFNPHEVLADFDGVVVDAMDALSPKCGLIAEAVNVVVFLGGRGRARRVREIARITGFDTHGYQLSHDLYPTSFSAATTPPSGEIP